MIERTLTSTPTPQPGTGQVVHGRLLNRGPQVAVDADVDADGDVPGRWSRARLFWTLFIADLAGFAAIAAGTIALGFRFHFWRGQGVALLLTPIVLYIAGGYARQKTAVRAGLGALGAVLLLDFLLFCIRVVPIMNDGVVLPVALAGWAAIVRLVLTPVFAAHAQRLRWLVIGSRRALDALWADHRKVEFLGDFTLVATDDAPGEAPVEAPAAQLDRYLGRRWSGIVIESAERLQDDQVREVMLARLHGLRVYELTEFYEQHARRVPVRHLRDRWVATSHGFRILHDHIALRAKRVSDVALAAAMLLLTAPVIALVALAVKLSSRGPVLFRQERVGQRGATFTVLKFRTMVVGSENGDKYTQPGDSRITRIGSLLRRSRLDELPQLWNILVGDMSFVGPRAEWTKCVAAYEDVIPFYHLRHVVKPGLTGWAQVNYPYGASVEDALEKLEFDLYYIKHHSLWFDLLIVLRTVRVVLFGMGR